MISESVDIKLLRKKYAELRTFTSTIYEIAVFY